MAARMGGNSALLWGGIVRLPKTHKIKRYAHLVAISPGIRTRTDLKRFSRPDC